MAFRPDPRFTHADPLCKRHLGLDRLQHHRLVHHGALPVAGYSRHERAFNHDVLLEILQHVLTHDPNSCSALVAILPPVGKLLVRFTY